MSFANQTPQTPLTKDQWSFLLLIDRSKKDAGECVCIKQPWLDHLKRMALPEEILEANIQEDSALVKITPAGYAVMKYAPRGKDGYK